MVPLGLVGAACRDWLLSQSDHVVVWADTREPVDLYDVEVWETLAWGPFAPAQDEALQRLMPETASREEPLAILRTHMTACLRNASAFHRALDRLAWPPDSVRIHSFVGDFLETPATLRVDRVTGAVEWDQNDVDDRGARSTAVSRGPAGRSLVVPGACLRH